MKPVYIVAAKRTAIGNFLGSLSKKPASELGAELIKHLITTYNLPTNSIDEVILGQVLTGGQGQNPARQSAIKAGLDVSTPAMTINKVCGSGLKAIGLAFQAITLGDADLIIAGGQESMSLALHGVYLREGTKFGDNKIIDLMQYDGLTDAFNNYAMGCTAENLAKKYNISREEQDEFAFKSQQKAATAQNLGKFHEEILPFKIQIKKEIIEFSQDEFVRPKTTIEGLSALKPAFNKEGTVTAGTSSGINDGAAVLMLASEEAVKKYNLQPIAKVAGFTSAGVPPEIMGIGPVYAVQKLLKKLNWSKEEIDLVELNEAFAAQAIAVNKELGFSEDKVNVNGGALALGHPIGASGARVAVTLLHEMLKRDNKKGIASLCIGGGMGVALGIERV